MKHITALLLALLSAVALQVSAAPPLKVGAERPDMYMPLLQGKRVGLMSNHTGLLPDGRHTVDDMLTRGVNVRVLFSPEHGFRGTADAGEHVASGVDKPTGLPIASLYDGRRRGPSKETMDSIDVIVCDIQDVGTRFYTYYITMWELMCAAAREGKEFVVLDRPNPNGMYVDGPLLDMKHASGVGRLPLPVVHGMTLGELARMIAGEGWLDSDRPLALSVVPCEGYTHATRYRLPVAPSPNLRTMQAVYLYPSVCLFEGTRASLGRGTDTPFEIYGHPAYRGGSVTFTPRSVPGAKNPPLLGRKCRGRSLSDVPEDTIIARGLDLSHVIDAYTRTGLGESFFTPFFEKLAGTDDVRRKILRGRSADEIKAGWAGDVEAFRTRRRPYLLYPEK